MKSSPRPSRTASTLSLIAVATLMFAAGCAATRLGASAHLSRRSKPLQAAPPNAQLRLLVVGDSTAVGVGASTPQRSVAGLIASEHPDWSVENRARDGARFADVLQQLEGAGRQDVVLVMVGGNDVIRLTGGNELRRSVREVAVRSSRLAPHVTLLPPGNVGNAPFFWPPLSWWMSARARELHAAVREAAQDVGAVYVNLYRDQAEDPFAREPLRMNAADGLHPSDDGYQLWHAELKRQGGLPR